MPISLKNAASILPWVRYSPQANTLAVAGEDNKPREVPFIGKSFAFDPENATMGWLLIGEGIRDWRPFAITDVPPTAPGPNYRRGFAILVYAPKLLGSPEAHEMCSSTGAHMSFCERLYNQVEAQFGTGKIPVVKIMGAEPIKIGKGKSRELQFEIVKWIDRPAAIVEAIEKLKTATGAAPKNDAAAANDKAEDDFGDEGDVKATANEEPKEAPATESKPKRPRKTTKPPESSSDILEDEIPFS